MPSSTVEDYLKAILKLQGPSDERVSPGAVAQALAVAPGPFPPLTVKGTQESKARGGAQQQS